MIPKDNGKWRVSTNYTDLNKVCPKDSFPLVHIDQLINVTAGHKLLSLLDAYSEYNHIRMDPEDQEKISFITEKRTYCYNVMPFGLKNAGATYQKLVNTMFKIYIEKSMEVYMDYMIVKSLQAKDHLDHLDHLKEIFFLHFESTT